MALTAEQQAQLSQLEAKRQAVAQEMQSIVTKTNVSASQRAADNARIVELNKQAASLYQQEKSIGSVDTAALNNTLAGGPGKTQTVNPTVPTSAATTAKGLTKSEANTLKSQTGTQATSSPATIEKAQSLIKQQDSLQAQLAELQKDPTANAAKIRSTNNQINSIKNQFATDPNLIGYASKNLSAGDKFALLGLAAGSTSTGASDAAAAANLIKIGAALNGAENSVKTKKEPEPEKQTLGKELREAANAQGVSWDDIVYPPEFDFNVLHGYSSYTYNISLHMLDPKTTYPEMLRNPKGYVPRNVIIASAGRFQNEKTLYNDLSEAPRNAAFQDDFYFDNLRMDTVIGLNATTKNTNTVKLSFTIIEPYGVTLLDRIIDAADYVNAKNYLEIPYLLQIEFFGIDDAGKMSLISGITKRIPIKLNSFKVKVDTKGSSYQLDATPFNHQAYDVSTVETKVNFEVSAGTIGEFFDSSLTAANREADNLERDEQAKTVKTSPFGTTESVAPAPMALSPKQFHKVNSLTEAYNAWQKSLVEIGRIKENDIVAFEIHPEIAKASLKWKNEKLSLQDIPMASIDSVLSASVRNNNTGANNTTAIEIKRDARTYSINAGTTIDSIITTVINNSSYITDQLIVPEEYADEEQYRAALEQRKNQPFYSFKVTSKIELLNYDVSSSRWARKITYQVQPYTVANVKVPYAPQGKVKRPAKRYNYMYTGKNNDIISFDIDFDTAYYTAITAFRHHGLSTASVTVADANEQQNQIAVDLNTSKTGNPNKVQPLKYIADGGDKTITTAGDVTTNKESLAADIYRSVYSSSRGDMINVKLKIVGDPLFIKQDDIFYSHDVSLVLNKQAKSDASSFVTPNGSLITDRGEIYVLLTFRTPVDMNEKTGLAEFEKYKTSSFSGMYKIITVNSEFRNGQFTQELQLSRLFMQDSIDYPKGQDKTDSADEREKQSPGKDGISEVAPIGPSFKSDPADTAPSTAAAEPAPVPTEAEAVKTDPDLKAVNDTAPTETITAQTEPQAVVPSEQTFAQAFREARAAYGGPGGLFYWKGKPYQTNIAGEEYVNNPTPVF